MKFLFITILALTQNISAAEYVIKLNYNESLSTNVTMADDCIPFKDFKEGFGTGFKTMCSTEADSIYKCNNGFNLGSVVAIKFKDLKTCKSMKTYILAFKLNSGTFFK